MPAEFSSATLRPQTPLSRVVLDQLWHRLRPTFHLKIPQSECL